MAEAEYKGASVVVIFNTVDISGHERSTKVTEEAAEPDAIDVTVKGDSTKQSLEGLPGDPKTTVDFEALDADSDTVGLMLFAMNAKDTLFIYPQGKTHGLPKLTINNARLVTRTKTIPYDGAVAMTAKFTALNTVTWSTYTSVTA